MTEEQEKAIYRLKIHTEFAGISNGCCIANTKDVKTILSMLEEKNKQIDLMSEQLAGLAIFNIDKDETLILSDKEEVKQYFQNKAKELINK